MSLYTTALFLHVLGALGLFAALGIEWAIAGALRRATDPSHAKSLIGVLRPLHRVAGPSAVTILVTGVYMGMTGPGRQAWIGLGFLGLVVVGALGGAVTGRRVAAVLRELESGSATSGSPMRRLQDPALAISLRLRTAIATGVIFLMTTKPTAGLAVAAMIVAVALGLVWSVPMLGRRRSATIGQTV